MSDTGTGSPDPARTQQPRNANTTARLTKRADFLRAARGRRYFTAAFNLQAAERPVADNGAALPRFGFTVTKKTGNAVERNRIRRRMREALRKAVAAPEAGGARPGHDYVIVARREAISRPFDALVQDLRAALAEIHTERARRTRKRRQPVT